MIYIPSLGYSFHLSNDKNKKNSSKASAKSNLSGTTSNSNNAIQNANVTIIIVGSMMTESMILKLLEALTQS